MQSMPRDVRDAAIAADRGFTRGELLVFNAISADGVDADGPPWPLTRAEMEAFARDGVTQRSLDVVEGALGRLVRLRVVAEAGQDAP